MHERENQARQWAAAPIACSSKRGNVPIKHAVIKVGHDVTEIYYPQFHAGSHWGWRDRSGKWQYTPFKTWWNYKFWVIVRYQNVVTLWTRIYIFTMMANPHHSTVLWTTFGSFSDLFSFNLVLLHQHWTRIVIVISQEEMGSKQIPGDKVSRLVNVHYSPVFMFNVCCVSARRECHDWCDRAPAAGGWLFLKLCVNKINMAPTSTISGLSLMVYQGRVLYYEGTSIYIINLFKLW